jgi:hypothetical protein
MPFDERTDWVDTPSSPPPPGSTPVHAADIKRWERGIAEAHEELADKLSKADADATYGRAFPASQTIDYTNGNVTSVTEDGITTTYTYNADGTVDTDTRQGVTRKYTYTGGNLTKIEVQ